MANTVRNMHYDFKQKLNKIDSQQNKNFKVPEIDWKINEAMNIFIKQIASPKYNQTAGFESSQRNIDSIRPIVVENVPFIAAKVSDTVYAITLPADYMQHVSSSAYCKKGSCDAYIRTTIIQHDDKDDDLHSSCFEWRDLNIMFSGNLMTILTDGTFTVEKVYLTYIRLPKYVHNAADFIGGTYTLPDGTVLTGYQNCELPVTTHSEIIDIAVLITTGDLLSSYQLKQNKLQITN